ncbi:MAG TPA: hypothetical protein VJ729_01810 [Nitrososphaeraceae archaeon]|nr:hypothetical protein [Nitrososphaeraceae archaeon]
MISTEMKIQSEFPWKEHINGYCYEKWNHLCKNEPATIALLKKENRHVLKLRNSFVTLIIMTSMDGQQQSRSGVQPRHGFADIASIVSTTGGAADD